MSDPIETEDGCSHVVDDLVMPIVDEHLKPKIGMTFDNLEEAEKFYKNYGKVGGFDIRNSTTNYGKDRELIGKSYVCSKEGVLKSKSLEIRRCGTIRTNCKALIRLKLDKNIGIWSVYKFVEEHNHTITSPSRTHFLRGNREVTSAKKTLIKQFGEVNIPTNKQMAFFENSSGGFHRIGCIETDVRNYERDLREERRGHDAQMMLDHFKSEQEKNPSFYYVYEVDEEKRLTHCFWVDGIARMNYQHFGDVVSFDATHNTNQYGLVFVPFVGINHHWQSVFLGCGLIPNEEAKSFVWLFNKWIEAMGHPPSGMITDQCLGICKAIETVFPEIRHRFCIWHILDKVSEKLGKWAYNMEFMKSFKDNIWDSETATSFEENWVSILKKNGLETHDWLKDIYEIREKWAPVYHKQYFWAGMSSSQRSEGMNALLKKHISRKNSLHDFVTIFQRVLARQREGELKEDHCTVEKKPKLKTLWSMEKQMAQIYTKKIFYIFQDELQPSLMYNIELVKENERESTFQLNFCGHDEKLRHIIYCKTTKMVRCSCLMFEFKGIPCRHILAYLKITNHSELPEQYILKRWCRNVRKRVVLRDGVFSRYSS
ncbi:protein FAR1-RELATED SEQUENCE 5-like [Asparagus officinalis]|uniref:protein FAR1-RELATED SEQUENCE 5-like n=1 Tax=Asparagus officinalis TaxID=4686 RepID=UPI00098E65E4|nr:protein FAR1-RELATED SEQUENCE 5-like [Asparagus officinalis]